MTAEGTAPLPLPMRALDTTAERPWPVRLLTTKIADYIAKMAPVWVEGQVVQLNRRAEGATAFLVLRDTDVDMSLPVSVRASMLQGLPVPLREGAHVVVRARPTYWTKRGSFSLQADELRPVGVGELLARIEHLKRVLAAEGLFDPARKVALPFLPHVVGLVCGRGSKAEHDVVVNARERWPDVTFEIREVAVQGTSAVPQVSAAIAELDEDPRVEVIVVARVVSIVAGSASTGRERSASRPACSRATRWVTAPRIRRRAWTSRVRSSETSGTIRLAASVGVEAR